MRGRFIVFEGIDGSGKTTQIELLAARLRADGRTVDVTAEPTSSVSGGILRDALAGLQKRTPCEMASLFVADRIFHNVNPAGIEATLARGIDVICDRYYYSTLAYQGSQTDAAWVREMNLGCPEIRKPDLCVFLDLAPDVALARIAKGRTSTEIYERRDLLEKFRKRFFEVFDELKERDKIVVIDTDDTIESIADKVYAAVKNANL